jgi:hypothetical protein
LDFALARIMKGKRIHIAIVQRRAIMSDPTVEYWQAKADLCRQQAINEMVEGESALAAKNLLRMVNALSMVGIINDNKRKVEGKDE